MPPWVMMCQLTPAWRASSAQEQIRSLAAMFFRLHRLVAIIVETIDPRRKPDTGRTRDQA
jgi:hypothetical protein